MSNDIDDDDDDSENEFPEDDHADASADDHRPKKGDRQNRNRGGEKKDKKSFAANAVSAGLKEFGEVAMAALAEAGFEGIPLIQTGFNAINEKIGSQLTNMGLMGLDVFSRGTLQSTLMGAGMKEGTAEMLAEILSGAFQGLRTANAHGGDGKNQQNAIREQFRVAKQLIQQRLNAFTYVDASQALDADSFADLDDRLAAMSPEQRKTFDSYTSQLTSVKRLRTALERTKTGSANARVELLLKFLARWYKPEPPKEEKPLAAVQKLVKKVTATVTKEVTAIVNDSEKTIKDATNAFKKSADERHAKNLRALRELAKINNS